MADECAVPGLILKDIGSYEEEGGKVRADKEGNRTIQLSSGDENVSLFSCKNVF